MRSYGSRFTEKKEDPKRCIESVYAGVWDGSNQCSRKRGHGEDGLYCKQHDPANVKAKRDARHAKWEKEAEARTRKYEMPIAFKKALEEIAKGELNDPAGYAQMTLDEWK